MARDGFPARTLKKYRSKGYVLHSCWKCGRQWFGGPKPTYLPAKKVYRHICRKCKEAMELN